MPTRQPTPIFVPFVDPQSAESTEISNLDQIVRTTLNPSGAIPTDPNIPQIISNLNTISYNAPAVRVDYDTTCQWKPMSSGHVVKMFLNLAIIGDMQTLVDDDVDMDLVTLTIEEEGTNKTLFSNSYDPGLDQFNATDEVRMFILAESIDNQDFQVSQGVALNIRLQTTLTIGSGGTAPTFFNGVAPFFPLTADTFSKMFSQSGIVFYVDRFREKFRGE